MWLLIQWRAMASIGKVEVYNNAGKKARQKIARASRHVGANCARSIEMGTYVLGNTS